MIQAIAAAAKAHSIAVVFGFPERGVDSNGRVMARADDGRPVVCGRQLRHLFEPILTSFPSFTSARNAPRNMLF